MTKQDAMQMVMNHGWTPTGYFDDSGRSLWGRSDVQGMRTLQQALSSLRASQATAA